MILILKHFCCNFIHEKNKEENPGRMKKETKAQI